MAMPVPRKTPLWQELAELLPGNLYRAVVRWRCQDAAEANHPRRSAKGGRSGPRNMREAGHRSNRATKAEIRRARAAKHRERERETEFDHLLLVEDERLAA